MSSQTKEMDLKLNPKLKGTLKALCNDPKTTVVVLSRSGINILDKVYIISVFLILYLCLLSNIYIFILWLLMMWYLNIQNFGKYNIWLAAENGKFLKHSTGEWVTNITQTMNLDWVDSAKVSKFPIYSIWSLICIFLDIFYGLIILFIVEFF